MHDSFVVPYTHRIKPTSSIRFVPAHSFIHSFIARASCTSLSACICLHLPAVAVICSTKERSLVPHAAGKPYLLDHHAQCGRRRTSTISCRPRIE